MTERCQISGALDKANLSKKRIHPPGFRSQNTIRGGLNPQVIRHSKEFIRLNFSAPCHLI